jgi:xanthine dehydrogenase YagR molybdenum-binding subunit
LAEKFSVPEEKVRVLSPIVGGAFGCKGLTWPHVPLCVAAVKVVGRPVKLSLPRQHYYRLIGGRTPTEQRVALGADREGKLTSLIHTGITTTSTSNMFTEQFTFPARHLYATPNLLVSQKLVKLDTVPPTFMRAPGETPGTFALESALDELSYATGIDPIELRLRNIGEKDPTTGVPYSIRHAKEMFAVAAGRFGWEKRNPAPRSMRDGRWLIGQGLASPYYPVYQEGTQASVRVFADGTALGTTAAHEMGMGTATVQMQNLAQTLGLPAEKVRFEIGDTRFPFAAVAGGSSQSISIGAAVLAACGELKSKLLALARKQAGSPFAGVKDEEIELRDGGLFLKGENGRGSSFVEIVRAAGEESVEAQGKSDAGDAPEKHSMGSYGALCCEVAIDEELGTLRVRRIVACYDVGRVLNAKTATSQFRGGIIMGLGMALMEETLLDHRFGRIVNPNLAEYHLPVQADVPEIEVHFLDRPDPFTPMGAHGIGEIGITGVAAAVANAVYHATGQRIRELPITCEKLMA